MLGILKIWKYLAAGFVGLIVLAVIVVWLMLNGLVRKAIETAATRSLQVQTTLGGAALSPFGGNVKLTDLAVASPEGFASPKMFTLGNARVSSGIGQLFGTPVRVSQITLNAPQLVIEQSGGKLNVMALSEQLKGGESKPADPDAESMKLVIDQLDVTDASVTIVPGIPGIDRTYHIALPAISLKNIGNADGTQTGEEIGRVVNELIAVMAAKAAESDQVPESVRQLMALDVSKVADRLEGRAKEEVKKATDKLSGELNELLGGKNK